MIAKDAIYNKNRHPDILGTPNQSSIGSERFDGINSTSSAVLIDVI
jgi:hypothetical protein